MEIQKPEHHTNTTTDSAMNDDPVEAAEGRSKAGQTGLDMGQWCRMWQTRQENLAQAQWDRGTHTHRSRPSHDDRWALEADPDTDVRMMIEVDSVGERQDEDRRCGDACDSLFHSNARAVERLARQTPDHTAP